MPRSDGSPLWRPQFNLHQSLGVKVGRWGQEIAGTSWQSHVKPEWGSCDLVDVTALGRYLYGLGYRLSPAGIIERLD
jgi:hypothetical protein